MTIRFWLGKDESESVSAEFLKLYGLTLKTEEDGKKYVDCNSRESIRALRDICPNMSSHKERV